MRTAVISDIHANLIGLRESLDAADRLRVERIVCLGDIVGYGPWPNECVQIIRERSAACVMGNHDRVAVRLDEPSDFNAAAREAILWTRGVLTETHCEFLINLPDRYSIDDSTILVHGSPRDPDEYIIMTGTARENMMFMKERLGADVGFFGHTHVPGIFDLARNIVPIRVGKIPLGEESVCLINPGSVGQPRDGDPRASFLIYDDEPGTLEFIRVSYDIHAVYQAVVDQGLPPYLGKRLFLGT